MEIDTLVAEFLETYYGGGAAAASVVKYIKLISTAFETGNRSVDFTGRVMDTLEAKSAIFVDFPVFRWLLIGFFLVPHSISMKS